MFTGISDSNKIKNIYKTVNNQIAPGTKNNIINYVMTYQWVKNVDIKGTEIRSRTEEN